VAIYKLSPRAEQDLIDIYRRGFQQWGARQAESYQREILSCFHLLSENPGIGRKVSIRPQLQRHEIKPYIIFYRKFSYGVRIARVLYKNRLVEKHI
jgi:toxin ParE1/3/4